MYDNWLFYHFSLPSLKKEVKEKENEPLFFEIKSILTILIDQVFTNELNKACNFKPGIFKPENELCPILDHPVKFFFVICVNINILYA